MVTLENLIAGAVLKFGFVDNLDMVLLMGGFKKNIAYQNVDGISKYIDNVNQRISLKSSYTLDTNISIIKEGNFTLRDYLTLKQGDVVKEYLENLDLKHFVLRKIKLLFSVRKESLRDLFNEVELSVLFELYNLGLIMMKGNDDIPYEDNEEIILTKQGEVELFIFDNKTSVESFVKKLDSLQYDPSLLRDFLATIPDLDSYILDNHSISEFEIFGSSYDRSVLK